MIESKRMLIRGFNESDAKSFYELTLDNGFNLFPINIYRQESVATTIEWIKNNKHKLGAWEKSTNTLIGMGGLTPWEFGQEKLVDMTYRFRESAWGKGYGFELAEALVHYGVHTLKLDNLTATIMPDNVGSKRIAEKLGMKLDQRITLKGVATDLYRL